MKIFNWVAGGFFRTIGRTLAFLFVGGLIAWLLSNSGFNITDLFLDHVNASELSTSWLTVNDITYYEAFGTGEPGYLSQQIYNSNIYVGLTVLSRLPINDENYKVYFDISNIGYKAGYDNVYFTIYQELGFASEATAAAYPMTLRPLVYLGQASCEIYNYTSTNDSSDSYDFPTEYQQITVKCPVSTGGLTLIYDNKFGTYWLGRVFINRNIVHSKGSVNSGTIQQIITEQQSTNSAINNQTQQQQQHHQEAMNSSITDAEDDASDFFGNFTVQDHGGLNSIITAPLNTIRSLLTSTCTNLVLPLPFVNQNLTLPCMNNIYTTHFGLFFTLYQTIILAIISYRCLRSIFFDITGFTNPDDDRIEVMDL